MSKTFGLALAMVCLMALSCATTPTQRAPILHPRNASMEVAFGGYGIVNGNGSGGGTALNLLYRTPWEFDVFAQAHASALANAYGFSPRPSLNNAREAWSQVWGGQVGIRSMFRFKPDMIFASEFALDYLEDSLRAGVVRHASAFVRFPVAQQVWGNLWAFVSPLVGLSLPLYEGPPLPFFGVSEIPLGLYWQMGDTWALMIEGGAYGGGFWAPKDGGYLALSLVAQNF